MAFENERKFLLRDDSWKKLVTKKSNISQGYVNILPNTIKLLKRATSYFLKITIPDFELTKKISKKDFYLIKNNFHQEHKVLRVRQHDNKYFLTIKIDIGVIGSKIEVEPLLSKEEFQHLFKATSFYISKERNYVEYENHTFEIDVFKENKGLVLAEVEVEHLHEDISFPDWIGEEVTEDVNYYNFNLSKLK